MPTKYLMARDVAGYNGFGLPFSLDGRKTILVANTEQHFTIPSTYAHYIAIVTHTQNVDIWVDGIGTAAIAGAGFSSSTSVLLANEPMAFFMDAGDVFSVISSSAASPVVCVRLYVAPPYTN